MADNAGGVQRGGTEPSIIKSPGGSTRSRDPFDTWAASAAAGSPVPVRAGKSG